MKTLLIDNYDSFTYNLYQYLTEINGEETIVIRNDELSLNEIRKLNFDNIVISPGPGNPQKSEDFGICKDVINNFNVPILGVCLGHQGIGSIFGNKIIHAKEVMHGRLSKIYHNNDELFFNIEQGFQAVRYHSLILEEVNNEMQKIAWCEDGTIMAIKHNSRPIYGVQFHPESIYTEYGKALISNFKNISQKYINKDMKYNIVVKKINELGSSPDIFISYYSQKKDAIWLDSNRIIDNFSRFSYMGCIDGPLSYKATYYCKNKKLIIKKANETIELEKSIFDFIEEEIKKYDIHSKKDNYPFEFLCGFAGFFGYEMKSDCGYAVTYHSKEPDAVFLFLDRIIVFDHLEKTMYFVSLVESNKTECANQWFDELEKEVKFYKKQSLKKIVKNENEQIGFQYHFDRNYEQYLKDINLCFNKIYNGESYEICLTNTLYCDVKVNPLKYYMHLRDINPAPYACYMKYENTAVACASIERFLKISSEGIAETRPMKGTIKRSDNPIEDERLRKILEEDEKTFSENLMICDLCRNDLGTVCEIGSITLPALMSIETYATVHQMTSTIRGKLKKGVSSIDCIKKLFPGGSMTGAPKKRTMEIIENLEKKARGIYSGAIGYISLDGAVDLNIVIRTAVIHKEQVEIGVGGAIIAMSDPIDEYEEIVLKSKALVNALNDVYLASDNE